MKDGDGRIAIIAAIVVFGLDWLWRPDAAKLEPIRPVVKIAA